MKDHVARLETAFERLNAAIADLYGSNDHEELLRLIRKPGWTTPAEMIFVEALTAAAHHAVEQVATIRGALVAGGNKVGLTPVGARG